MLSQTEPMQVDDGRGVLQSLVPVLRARQKYRDGLLRLEVHMNVAAIRARMVSAPGMIIRGVQPHALVVGREPIENFLLCEGRLRGHAYRQECENGCDFCSFHSNSIGTRHTLGRKFLLRTCL